MAAREELIILFDEMATALELLGANAFKVNANRKVARVLEDMTEDLTPLADDPAALQKFDGIGKSSAVKICEFPHNRTDPGPSGIAGTTARRAA